MTDEGTVVLPQMASDDPRGCVSCAERVAERVRVVPGVVSVDVALSPARLLYRFETERVTPAEVERLVEREAESVGERFVHQVLAIEGMDCADCAKTLERGVGRLSGVELADVNFAAATMTVEYDRSQVGPDDIGRRVAELGYSVTTPEDAPETERGALLRLLKRRNNALALAAGLLTLAGAAMMVGTEADRASNAIYALAVAVGGAPLAVKGVRTARATRSLDINMLMTIAVIGAAAIGDWFEAATVVFLFSLGEALEGYAMDRVRRSVRSLLSLAPPSAIVRRGDSELELPVGQIQPGELVVVRAGQRIPLDGVVVSGRSSVDQSPLTGESLPVEKEPGSPLFAGTMNGYGPLTLRVTRVAGDSSVARIIRLVEQAQSQRAPSQRLVDRFARVYTPAVIAGAIAVAVLPPLFGGDWLEWFSRALVLLVISCPCALVLSTPISVVSALSAAARLGTLIKGGAVLERAGQIDTVAFDKTGTLTAGKPVVTDVIPLNGGSPDQLLALAATLERHSEHPLGKALVRAAQERGLTLDEALDVRVVPGAGLVGAIGAVEYRAGALRLFDPAVQTAEVSAALDSIQDQGRTSVLLGTNDRIMAAFAFGDEPREDAIDALRELRAAGVEHFVVLSGDRQAAVGPIASAVGISRVEGDLLPEDKLAAIDELRRQGRVVAMVGDGINDAPSLAAADVGIAMGAAGTDAAVETADIALMGDDLRGVARAVRLGRKARSVIAANIAVSIGVKVVFLALAVAGTATLWMAIAADLGTSLLVIANGLRLLRWRG